MDQMDQLQEEPQQQQFPVPTQEQEKQNKEEIDTNDFFNQMAPMQGRAAAAAIPNTISPLPSEVSEAHSPMVPPADSLGVSTDNLSRASNQTGFLPVQQQTKNGGDAMEAVRKQIEARTVNIDTKTKEKEAKQVAAAQAYMKEENTKREKKLKQLKEEHKKQQKTDEAKRNEFKKSGAIWNGVGLMTDLNKANKYSKNTERMRNILIKLNETKNA